MTFIYDVTGGYGPDWRRGVLVDDLARATALGLAVRTLTRTQWVVSDDPAENGLACPVVCGHLVWVYTEDGRMDGRCGVPAVPGRGACDGHADERDEYQAMTEAERAYTERQEEYA